VNRKLIHGLIPVVVIIGAATLGAIVSAQSTRATSDKKGEKAAKVATPAPDVDLQEPADRKPLSFYVSSVKGDLFAPERPPLPKPVAKPAPIITTPPAPVNPLADYAYTGTVEMNGTQMALVENVKTKEGQYLKVGDSFMGGTVSRLDDRTVGIMVAKTEQTMAKRDDYSLTSLDKNAPFLNAPQAAPGQPQPGQPGAPGADGATGFPGMGGRGNWMQRFQNMTPEQRQQMQQRMLNRGFDRRGGGGGGGRRGGGGGGMMNFFGGG
jgi:hypothetical protein